MSNGYRYLGFFLLAAFVAQEVADLRWPWLSTLQSGDLYAQLSGFVLLGLVAHQWHLAAVRSGDGARAASGALRRHRLAGVLAPAFFYAHSQHLGLAYLQLLSLVYLAVSCAGLLNGNAVLAGKAWVQWFWIVIHVGLATALLFLTGYHIYVVYTYE